MAPFPSPTTKWHTTAYPTILPSRPELSAKGKSVLITGGGTGIGAETARAFSEAGASRIALLGRRMQLLLATKARIEQEHPGVEIFVASTDVSNKKEVDDAFNAFARSGKIDIVVSNAATEGPRAPISEVDGTEFMETFHANLLGALYLAQAFLRFGAEDAVAIETNSSAAHYNFGAEYGTYSAVKLAAFRVWDSMAAANPQISVFHYQPGIVDTDMNRRVGGAAAVGFSDDVSLPACFSVWLASPEAKFLKSKFLWANWDVDELKARAEEIQGSTFLNVGLVGWPFGADESSAARMDL